MRNALNVIHESLSEVRIALETIQQLDSLINQKLLKTAKKCQKQTKIQNEVILSLMWITMWTINKQNVSCHNFDR